MTDLEQQLTALGDALDVPPTPDLAAGVQARIAGLGPGRRRSRRRTVTVLALGFAVLLAGTALAVTPVRHAIENVFDLRGARVDRVRTLPRLPSATRTADALGERITLSSARSAASFRALLPGPPAEAYVAHDVAGGRITIRDRGILITEFRGTVGPYLQKLVGLGTRARPVRVNGATGLFLSGAPHEIFFRDANGLVRTDTMRLAGNVLLWHRGALVLRIEGTRSLAQALRLARSLS